MGLFDVFKKNDNSEGGEYHSMERSADAPTAGAVRQAVETPAPASTSAASQPPRSAQQAPKPQAMDTPLPAITPNKLMSVNNPEILKREDSARVLGYFIERYDADKTVANLQNCMNNFMDVCQPPGIRPQHQGTHHPQREIPARRGQGCQRQTPYRRFQLCLPDPL